MYIKIYTFRNLKLCVLYLRMMQELGNVLKIGAVKDLFIIIWKKKKGFKEKRRNIF